MSEPRVTMDTVRKSGHCFAGVRETCKIHGIDVRRLAREGIPISEVEDIDDAYVQQMVNIAKKGAS